MRRRRTGIKLKPKNAPGDIKTSCKMHDGAVVISGGLTVITDKKDFGAVIAGRLETAALKIKERGGIVGHIKASAAESTAEMISVTDEAAMIKKSLEYKVRISLAVIVFKVEPEEAEKIVRAALKDISERSVAAAGS